jgi:hypothetical protein
MLEQQHIIELFRTGKNQSSTGLILPSQIVKKLGINPLTEFLLLKVMEDGDLWLRIINKERLLEVNKKNRKSTEKFPRLSQ